MDRNFIRKILFESESYNYPLETPREAILNLQPSVSLILYHGTSQKNAYIMAKRGVDSRKIVGRLYPHTTNKGKLQNRGIYLSPIASNAGDFAGPFGAILAISVKAKDLYPMFPHELKDKELNKELRLKYPNSFRPVVTNDLLTRGIENQALHRGLIPANSILFVADSGKRRGEVGKIYNREEFILKYEERDKAKKDYTDSPLISPEETNITVKDAFDRLHQDYPKMSREKIEDIIKKMVERHKDEFEILVSEVMNYFNTDYTVARRLSFRLLRYFNLKENLNEQ